MSGGRVAGRGGSAAPRLRWRVIVDGDEPGARNMALDHALARTLRPGEAVFRLYGWSGATVSLGRNEPARGRYIVAGAPAERVAFVRRPTGGRAVLHDGDLTYAVAMPARALGGPRAAYAALNAGLLRGLELLGTRAELSAGGPAVRPHAGPCFAAAAAGEIVVRGEKLVGSAQARLDGALLQHGSILVGSDQSDLRLLLGEGPSDEGTGGRHLGGLDLTELRAALEEGLRRALGGCWYKDEYRAAETVEAERLEEQRYARDEWTWRL